MKKILSKIIIASIILVMCVPSLVFAGAVGEISQKGTTILNAISWVGYAMSLMMIVIVGVKYILASAEGKASLKKSMISWIIGAFIVFAATTIVGWVVSATNLNTSSGLAQEIIDAAK